MAMWHRSSRRFAAKAMQSASPIRELYRPTHLPTHVPACYWRVNGSAVFIAGVYPAPRGGLKMDSQSTTPGRRSAPPPRTAVLASADLSFRQRVRDALIGLRWQVREAAGGAEVLAQLDAAPADALILDSWLPDLEVNE